MGVGSCVGRAEAAARVGRGREEKGALQQGAEPSRGAARPAGDPASAATGDAGPIAQLALTGLPMGMCFPCPGESAPPSPDVVSTAALPRLRVRQPAPRAPVPGRGCGRPRAADTWAGGWARRRGPQSPPGATVVAETCGRAPGDVEVPPAGPGSPPPCRSPRLGYPELSRGGSGRGGSPSFSQTLAKLEVRRTQAYADGAV